MNAQGWYYAAAALNAVSIILWLVSVRMLRRERLNLIFAQAAANVTLARIRMALDDAPVCDVHDDDDPVTCGWKSDVLEVRRILEEGR